MQLSNLGSLPVAPFLSHPDIENQSHSRTETVDSNISNTANQMSSPKKNEIATLFVVMLTQVRCCLS